MARVYKRTQRGERADKTARRRGPGYWILRVSLLIYAFVILFPLAWIAITALKTDDQIYADPLALPASPAWGNFAQAWTQGGLGLAFWNSLFVTVVAVVIVALGSAMAAYPLARASFLGRPLFYYLFLSGTFLAPITAIVPLLKLLRNLGLYNTPWALIFPNVAFGLPISIFLMRSYYLSLPRSLEDAARVDGLSPWRTFFQVILPLARPALYTVVILQTIFIWNEYLFALVFLNDPATYTLPRALVAFQGTYVTQYGPLAAGTLLTALPTILLYLVFSDRVRQAMAVSGGKG